VSGNFDASPFMIHLCLAVGPTLAQLVECGGNHAVTYDCHVVASQPQVDCQLQTAGFVTLFQGSSVETGSLVQGS
jgi:hypothetical protein